MTATEFKTTEQSLQTLSCALYYKKNNQPWLLLHISSKAAIAPRYSFKPFYAAEYTINVQ